MKKEADIEMILSNISIRPDETAKKAAYERMMARHAKLLATQPGNSRRTLSIDDLDGIAAAGLPPNEINNVLINYKEEDE